MSLTSCAKVDFKTKNLVKRLNPGDIAVICHEDLDEVGASSLVAKKVKAVINARKSITGKYPNLGPEIILDANILLIDNVGEHIMQLEENTTITITDDGKIYSGDVLIAEGQVFTKEILENEMEKARQNIEKALDDFIDNTLEYAKREKYFIMGGVDIPQTDTCFEGKHVLIVVRGNNFKEDLAVMKTYIDEMKPVLVGVDGGADALMEFGYKPDVVIGDMDSVSDEALKRCDEIIVHAYPDGRAPGLARIKQMGLSAKKFVAPGTSEDIAMLLAYEKGADLIVAVGSHSNMIDFLEKGRKGMASTFLVRLKVGSILIDAKGASKLYNQKLKPHYILGILVAALVPITMILMTSPPMQYLLKLLELRIKMIMG
ncbi:MAG TPA: hypothetical protein GX534_04635 [Thermoanaerobacterales bacterium]|nr:hypothetical protein [Thermoanaerobacterales bacterium]